MKEITVCLYTYKNEFQRGKIDERSDSCQSNVLRPEGMGCDMQVEVQPQGGTGNIDSVTGRKARYGEGGCQVIVMDTAKSYLLIASVFPSTWGANLPGEREDSGREC